MLFLQDVAYAHPNKDLLFADLNFSINRHDKVALIGNNGSGKSTLLNILAGTLRPSSGIAKADSEPYYVPQLFGQFNDYTVAEALCIGNKIHALHEILEGNVSESNLTLLDDDWAIEERCKEAFAHWKLGEIALDQKIQMLSGGQKTKVFLAGIMIHEPEIVLLDEPSNHLDSKSRTILYDYIRSTAQTLVVVSHDRTLLNLLNTVFELSKRGIAVYGGNYGFYAEQKAVENEALSQDLKTKEKALRKAKETERETIERQQKLDARGKKQQEKAGLPRIAMNTFKNNAEKSTSKIRDVHAGKIDAISQQLSHLRREIPGISSMKIGFDDSGLHKGKILISAEAVQVWIDGHLIWKQPLGFQIMSGERIAIRGANGSGKTTLINVILGKLEPQAGSIYRSDNQYIYIDQDYTLIANKMTVYEQAQRYNSGALQEHEVKIRLNRFLFGKNDWNKTCKNLSGGEKMRLILCCLTISNQAPDMIVLDEPTNNLDIQNIEILTAAVNEYAGTLLVVSHDEYFLSQINTRRTIDLDA
jgi:ATPase subunit of ABC transporter with duplicated ATPase domains